MQHLQNIKADIALLPVSGTYVMTAEEAVRATRMIKPSVAIPMHYGSIVGSEDDARLFAEQLADTIEVVILEERIVFITVKGVLNAGSRKSFIIVFYLTHSLFNKIKNFIF